MIDELRGAVQPILKEPTPKALMDLQSLLLALEQDHPEEARRALRLAGAFYTYLSALQSKLSARQFNELASALDIGAVGAVALESIIVGEEANFWKRLLIGGVGEGLMVAASRQYIRAWDTETSLTHDEAAWVLFEELWRISTRLQPDLTADERRRAIDRLVAPGRDPATPSPERAALLGRVFQILLLTYLSTLLSLP
jgi:AcrR family transcriptional regulator